MSEVSVEVKEDKDWFLQHLVELANRGQVEAGVTLQVGGVLVSGTLVGGDKYFEGFANDWVSAIQDKEAAEEIRKSFASLGETVKTSANDENHKSGPSFIHLRDAKFFAHGGVPIPANRGIWWRGRISEVAGFVLGGLSVDRS